MERRGEVDDPLELLAAMSQDFATTLDVQATLKSALGRIMDYLDAEAASVFLIEDGGREIVCQSCAGPSDITGVRLRYGQGIVGRSIAEQTALIVRDVRKDPHFAGSVDQQSGFTTRSILCAPMTVQGRRLGAIEVLNKRSGDGLFAEKDRRLLLALASSAALTIDNAEMTKALIEQERFKRELELAAEMQRALLPPDRPPPFPVHGVNRPARVVSGDFYDFFELADGRICFNLGDVAGKGINASLLMVKASSLYRCLGKSIDQPGGLLARINREICDTVSRGMFVTMVGGIYDPRAGSVRLANAGHEPPLYIGPDRSFLSLPGGAPPLGLPPALVPEPRFPEIEIKLGAGSLYLFSDGVTEGMVASRGMLGLDGFKDLVLEHAGLPPARRLAALAGKFERANLALHDDLTILLVEDRRGTGER